MTAEPDLPANEDDEELIAYLDGELDPAKIREVESRVDRDSQSRTRLDSYRKTWELLDHLPTRPPSQSFTERTIERAGPLSGALRPAQSGPAQMVPHFSTLSMPVPRRPRYVWPLVIVVGIVAGYGGRALLVGTPSSKAERDRDALIFNDLRLLQNLHLYHRVDDMNFLREMDTADYFGEPRKDTRE